MALKGASPLPPRCFERELSGALLGISFYLPSRRRFIPYSWLHYAELNQTAKELYLHYTHAVVTITGANLEELHEAVEIFSTPRRAGIAVIVLAGKIRWRQSY